MKSSLLPLLLFCSLITACLSSRVELPPEHEFTTFSPLSLKPSYELFNLRVDLIRQTDQSGDSVITTDLRAYHPIGFNLGDGLFFDLNSNLSLRLDQTPGIDDPAHYKLRKVQNLFTGRGIIYTFQGGELCIERERINSTGRENCYQIRQEGAGFSLYRNKRFFLGISSEDEGLSYKRSRVRSRPNDRIVPVEGGYYVNRDRDRNRFILSEGTARLGNMYLLRRTDDGKKLEIYRSRASNRGRPLYSIRKSKEGLFIYDRLGRGTSIRYGERQIEVVRKERVRQRYFLEE